MVRDCKNQEWNASDAAWESNFEQRLLQERERKRKMRVEHQMQQQVQVGGWVGA